MEQAQGWPIIGDRYDPYDPRHPMWTDPFWATYCVNPANPQAPAATAGPTRDEIRALDSVPLPTR
jgi:hypothetical protein